MDERGSKHVRKRRRDSNVMSLPVRSDSWWMVDEDTGELLPPLRVRRFLEWFMDPTRPAGESLVSWSKQNGVHIETVRSWLHDPRFKRILDERCDELNLRPDRVQAVVDAMWAKAVDGSVEAAKLYLTYVGKMQPQKVEVHHTVDIRKMSDQELQAELQRLAMERSAIDVEESHAAPRLHGPTSGPSPRGEEVDRALPQRQAAPLHAHEASRDRHPMGEGSEGQRG